MPHGARKKKTKKNKRKKQSVVPLPAALDALRNGDAALIERLIRDGSAPAQTAYAEHLIRQGDETRAEELLMQAAEQKHPPACLKMAELYLERMEAKKKETSPANFDFVGCIKSVIALFKTVHDTGNSKSEMKKRMSRYSNILGFWYLMGMRGAKKCHDEARLRFEQAIEYSTHAPACMNLGYMYEMGYIKDTKDRKSREDAALKYYNLACIKGQKQAYYAIGAVHDRKGDPEKAFQHYKAGSSVGCISAINNLARCYREGRGTPVDREKAKRLHRTSALKYKNRIGQLHFGDDLFALGDTRGAFEYYTRSAAKKNGAAEAKLGWCYEEGHGVKSDIKKAIFWYKRSIEKRTHRPPHSDSNGLYRFGLCLFKGRGVPRNRENAFFCFAMAAQKGNADAQNCLSVCYRNGFGTPRSDEKAVQYALLAEMNGNTTAQCNVGDLYAYGIHGFPRRIKKAREFYKKCADNGDSRGLNRLAGIESDQKIAFRLYKESAEKGNVCGQINLAYMYLKGKGTDRDDNQAIRWFTKAADKGSSLASLYLAMMYLIGTQKSPAQAMTHIRICAEAGDTKAQFFLAQCYEKGIGCPVSEEMAYRWYALAAQDGHVESAAKIQQQWAIACLKRARSGF